MQVGVTVEHLYHSRPLNLAGPLKAVHVVIRNRGGEEYLLLPDEIVVLVETDVGTVPVPIASAHKNEGA